MALILLANVAQPRPLIVYNASRSVPLGFYGVGSPSTLKTGDLVLVITPASVRGMADRRRYLPATVPMIKHIAAMSGDKVCAAGDEVTINGKFAVKRQTFDPAGRPMPWWNGCYHLTAKDVFLLNPNVPLSFDGRYFGVVNKSLIIGKVHPL